MILAGAQRGIPSMVDGVNATAAALIAYGINPACADYMFCSHLSEEISHVEKANPNIRGLYTVINQEFIQKNWIDVKYVNREEDMGKEGLRKAKESYNPEFMVKKYNTIIK